MKNWMRYVGLALLVFVLAACGNTEEKVIDQTDENTTAYASDEDFRIIAGTTVIANILDQLNLNAVAIPDTEKQLPARFEGLPSIGNLKKPDVEIVKSLNPTEFLTVSTLEYELKDSLAKYKIPTDYLDLTSVENMQKEITTLGERYNRVAEAKTLNEQLTSQIKAVQDVATNSNKKPRVLILLGIPGSYLVATEHSYAGDLVRLAGGVNVMEGQEAEYLASNTEFLYNSNPDVILRLAHGMPEQVVEMFDEEFKTNDIWKHFDAVQGGEVYDLPEELFGTTAALNVPEALNMLQTIFYKE